MPILPIPQDAPKNVEHYVNEFHFGEEESYEVGLTNVDKDLLDWKFEPQKICVQCVECYTEDTARSVYVALLKLGHKGIGEVIKKYSGMGITKVFSLITSNNPY